MDSPIWRKESGCDCESVSSHLGVRIYQCRDGALNLEDFRQLSSPEGTLNLADPVLTRKTRQILITGQQGCNQADNVTFSALLPKVSSNVFLCK